MATKISTPKVIITEQPRSKPVRYRYKCEGRTAGTIPGERSTNENKTYPSIKIVNYQGNARVLVSCVTNEEPYRPHPHSLVGREGCKNGICTMDIPPTSLSIVFSNLGIQCARHRDISQVLDKRYEIGIDPFNTGFGHKNDSASFDMNVVRLCFQVFIENGSGECTIPLEPVVSEPVYDIKAKGALVICRLSECVSPVNGGNKDIYLLCKKVSKENIKVRFYEGDEDNPTWEGFPDIRPTQIHEQTAIWFRAPPYNNLEIIDPIKVFIQLLRPSDGAASESHPFQFLPTDAEPGMLKRKRLKFGNDPRRHILLELQNQLQSGTTATYYNIPPTSEHFTNLELNRVSGNEFTYPQTIPSTVNQVDVHASPHNEKILNSRPIDNFTPNYLQDTASAFLPSFQSFREAQNAAVNTHSPIYSNFVGNSVQQPSVDYFSQPAFPFIGVSNSQQQNSRQRVKNAIRAKCKNLQNTPNVSDIINSPIFINQLELRNNNSFFNANDAVVHNVAQNTIQNNFGMYTGNANCENLNSLLDVNFEQLETLLIPPDEDQYNSLNIPMNAMTISETSCNLSSLLNVDSSQLPTTINSDQLDNLLSII